MATSERVIDTARLLSILQKEGEFIIKPFHSGEILNIIIEDILFDYLRYYL